MTPQEIAEAIGPVIDRIIAERMEQVYGEIENLKGEVREAVEGIAATAQVLHDNDLSLMAEFQRSRSTAPSLMVAEVEASWERFIRSEAAHLGLHIMAPKG